MSDYCACGSMATFRCGCGTFLCRNHVLDFPGSHPRRPTLPESHHLAPLIAERLGNYGMCGSCYQGHLDHAARDTADSLSTMTDGTQPTIARTILDCGQWASFYQRPGLVFGQRVLAAMGGMPEWAHTDPFDTAAHLHSVTASGSTTIPVGRDASKETFLGGTKVSFKGTGDVTGWHLPFTYSDEGYREEGVVVVSVTGAYGIAKPSKAKNEPRAVVPEVNEQDSFAARLNSRPAWKDKQDWLDYERDAALSAVLAADRSA